MEQRVYIPHEYTIIGAFIHYRKYYITYDEYNSYMLLKKFHIDIEHDFNGFDFVKVTDSGYHIDQIPQMPPDMIRFLL